MGRQVSFLMKVYLLLVNFSELVRYNESSCDEESEYSEEDEAHRIRSNRLNPCNDLYWQDRGYACRPADWKSNNVLTISTFISPNVSYRFIQ